MQIELSKAEVELLDTALEAWEKEAHTEGLIEAIVRGMMQPRTEAEARKETKAAFEVARSQGKTRRMKALMLRAKLFQALARESEHDVTHLGREKA